MSVDAGVVERLIERGLVTPDELAAAEAVRRRSGGELGWILASQGVVTRREYFRALGASLGLQLVEDIEEMRRRIDLDLLEGLSYEDVLRYEFVPLARTPGGGISVATPRPNDAAMLAFVRERYGVEDVEQSLVTDLDLTIITSRTFRDILVEDAVMKNFRRDPEQSARSVFTKTQLLFVAVVFVGLILWTYFDPLPCLALVSGGLQLFYISSIAFKVFLSIAGATNEIRQPVSQAEIDHLDELDLPVYSVLVPLYKEPETVGQLVTGLSKLDYPQDRLDVLLLFEEDDLMTLEAAKASRPPANWRFVIVPNRQPRTKPKACNYGLFFARGEYLVIYDAEDIPDPAQLKMAVIAFRKNPSNYVCFQAALNYFNSSENLLTRMFTLEYSYWFDYLIPGLDRLGLPIPLGGTSNHFDAAKLRLLGGWDPFNTTEDADLGIRAAAQRYRVGFINSTTYEEANSALDNWIRQRSRWVKGYMQTFLVYWRRPLGLIQQIGLRDFLAFNLFIGGTPATFLAAPPLWGIFLLWLFTRSTLIEPLFPDWVLYVALLNLLLGNFLGIYLNMIAVYLRKNYALLPYSLLNPFYWILHSFAAYKALWQLFTKPFYWEKTRHGLSRVRPRSAPEERMAAGS